MMTFTFCFAQVFAACATEEDQEEDEKRKKYMYKQRSSPPTSQQGTDCCIAFCRTKEIETVDKKNGKKPQTSLAGWLAAGGNTINIITITAHSYVISVGGFIHVRCGARCRHFKFFVHTKAKKFFLFLLLLFCFNEKMTSEM